MRLKTRLATEQRRTAALCDGRIVATLHMPGKLKVKNNEK